MNSSPFNKYSNTPWRVSLHGGHSGSYCDHAEGSLEDIIEAAISAGYRVFGVTEHAPRYHDRYLYAEERALGWNVQTIGLQFEKYALHLDQLVQKYEGRIQILRGFEAEIVPPGDYVAQARLLMEQLPFDYFVGSVHYVNDVIIDYTPELYRAAVDRAGGVEKLQIKYYQHIRDMVVDLQPPVIGHFDLIRRFGGDDTPTRRVLDAAREALAAAAAHDCILDVNTAGYRKGLSSPYPAPEMVQMARQLGLAFCFGDDSHRPSEVGAGMDQAREYLISLGVTEVSCLERDAHGVHRTRIPL